tara:strand:+ start:572 stop:1453 length:882 start_codon:yes stop_codon:yes gene_type:complete
MEDIDLNIHNYDLNDLLNLFKLPFHFNESHLKDAKKIVLKTHPDKSKLDKKFFLFFSQAYKYLFKIHQLRQSSSTTNTDYEKDELWDKEQSIIIDGAVKTMDNKEYNKWFNDTFDKMKMKDEIEDSGYGDWLKSNEDIVSETISNTSEMNEYIQKRKGELRAVVVHQDFQDINNNNHFDLIRDTPENYGSSVFDKLQYEDLRKAHSESVIPVTDEDFHRRKKYSTVDELNRERTQDMINGEKEWVGSHEDKLKNMNTNDEDVNIRRAYKLMNQDEQIRDNYNKFWTDLKRIDN